ncbi:MAG: HdeD family acid-resistance protein, partial [Methylocella sp.]
PLIAAAFFTLLVGAAMIATGVVRVYLGVHLGAPLRSHVLLAGALTALVGILIVAGWPADRFVILGVLLGLDLAFWGAAWISFGLRLRRYRSGDE